MSRLIAVGFALGGLAHATGFVLLFRGVYWYGPTYPAWRHAVMASVDATVVVIALRRPAWLLYVLPAFVLEQLIVGGPGATPIVVAVGWIALLLASRTEKRPEAEARDAGAP